MGWVTYTIIGTVGLFLLGGLIVAVTEGFSKLVHLFRKHVLGIRLDYVVQAMTPEEISTLDVKTTGNVMALSSLHDDLQHAHDTEDNIKELNVRVQQYINDLTGKNLCIHSVKGMPWRKSFFT